MSTGKHRGKLVITADLGIDFLIGFRAHELSTTLKAVFTDTWFKASLETLLEAE